MIRTISCTYAALAGDAGYPIFVCHLAVVLMQSILQYRRFRRHLEQQIEKHGLENVAGCNHNAQSRVSNHVPSTTHDITRTTPAVEATEHVLGEKDLENGAPLESLQNSDGDGEKEVVERRDSTSSSTATSIHTSAVKTTSSDHPVGEPAQLVGTTLGQQMTGVSVRSQVTKGGTHGNGHIFVVGFQGDDDNLNPHNWSILKRISITMAVASIGGIVGFASSIDSAVLQEARMEFNVSEVAESLATALYLVGFGFGAFFAGPLSETFGRNPVYLFTGSLFMVFVMASALAPNLAAQLVFRTLAGFFGSTPLTCAGGTISDMWSPSQRTAVFPIFANSAFWGPLLGPVIGGFIGQSSVVGWRWVEWVSLIWAGLVFGGVLLFMPETYTPTLLKWKAENLRKITKDDRYMSELEINQTKIGDRILHSLYRPWLLVAFEPIVILFSLYITVVYIVLFTFLTGFEFIFSETYGLSQGLTFLIFLALAIGCLCATAWVPFLYKRYKRGEAKAIERGEPGLPPEQRLIFAMIGAPFLPIGLFWMGWTAYPSVSVWSPIISCISTGFAILAIFISTYQYLIDAFEKYAASALVGMTFIRYIASGGMIPVSIPFYRNLGVHWTLTVLGGISAVMVPVPYIFFWFGAAIRKKSRHAAKSR